MMILLYIIILVAGFFALVKGADIFVDGSCAIARRFHVSGLVIGLTIVSMGTSAPEMAVSIVAAAQGSNEIALSNVVGSNIFNALMILGICAIIGGIPVDRDVKNRDFPVMILSTAFVLPFAASGIILSRTLPKTMADNTGTVSRIAGIALLIAFAAYMYALIRKSGRNPEEDQGGKVISLPMSIFMIITGLLLIVAGGQAVVNSAKSIARAMGLTETLIGLTVVAVGTSLPECVTSVVAARKGQTALAVGNAVGSDIFNMMFVLGTSSAIHPVVVNAASVCDLMILLLICLMVWLFSRTKDTINRGEGIIMVLCYIADMVFAILR